MSEEINFNKTVFNKSQYTKTINTSFSELGVTTIQEELNLQPTVEEFFSLYNQLFYEIPEFGETNSHEYLIQQSSEYINFDANREIVSELQKEISQLREELLTSQRQTIELETNITTPDLALSTLPPSLNIGTSGGGTSGGGASSGGSSGGGGGY